MNSWNETAVGLNWIVEDKKYAQWISLAAQGEGSFSLTLPQLGKGLSPDVGIKVANSERTNAAFSWNKSSSWLTLSSRVPLNGSHSLIDPPAGWKLLSLDWKDILQEEPRQIGHQKASKQLLLGPSLRVLRSEEFEWYRAPVLRTYTNQPGFPRQLDDQPPQLLQMIWASMGWLRIQDLQMTPKGEWILQDFCPGIPLWVLLKLRKWHSSHSTLPAPAYAAPSIPLWQTSQQHQQHLLRCKRHQRLKPRPSQNQRVQPVGQLMYSRCWKSPSYKQRSRSNTKAFHCTMQLEAPYRKTSLHDGGMILDLAVYLEKHWNRSG